MRFQTETCAVDLRLFLRDASGGLSEDLFSDYNRDYAERWNEVFGACVVDEDELEYVVGHWQMECEHANRGMRSVLPPIEPAQYRAGAMWLFVCDEVKP